MLEGSYDVTTEWQEIEYEGTISAEQAGNSGMQTISFLVNELKEVINFYFDDISWEPLYTNSNGDDYVVCKKGYLMLPPKPETYAVLTQDKTSLTIYHDKDRKSHISEGMIYRISLKETPGWSNDANNITPVLSTPNSPINCQIIASMEWELKLSPVFSITPQDLHPKMSLKDLDISNGKPDTLKLPRRMQCCRVTRRP